MNKTYAIGGILAALILGAAPAIELTQTIGSALTPPVIKLSKAQVRELQKQDPPHPAKRGVKKDSNDQKREPKKQNIVQ